MSDITSGSSTNAQAVEQRKQQAFEQNQGNIPSDENKQRFAQKLQGQKQADDKKKAQKQEQNKESSKAQEQAKEKSLEKSSEKSSEKTLAGAKKANQKEQSLGLKEKDSAKNNPKSNLQNDQQNSQQNNLGKADAILQNLSGGQTTQATQATQQTQSANLQATNTASSTERLFGEFQAVADRVMLTENNLQQGGKIRLQLSESILPGTSVTFAMIGGALHATFSGTNKQSLDKILKHREKMAEHVQANSGVKIIIEAKEEEEQDNPR